MIKALGDPDDLVRRNAAWALGKIQVPHDAVVAALMAKLHEPEEDWSVRHNAALSLSWIGEPAVPALRRGLDAKVEWTRAYSADALLRIGGEERMKWVVPVVGQLLGAPEVSMRALFPLLFCAVLGCGGGSGSASFQGTFGGRAFEAKAALSGVTALGMTEMIFTKACFQSLGHFFLIHEVFRKITCLVEMLNCPKKKACLFITKHCN